MAYVIYGAVQTRVSHVYKAGVWYAAGYIYTQSWSTSVYTFVYSDAQNVWWTMLGK